MGSVHGKAAVVTGATRGIGLAIARALAERGASVWVTARARDQVDRAVAELSSRATARIGGSACDVRDPQSVGAMIRDAEAGLRGLDILINNAGIGIFKHVADMSVEDWRATLDTNLSGVFHCSREAIPALPGKHRAGWSPAPGQSCRWGCRGTGRRFGSRHC